MKRSLLEINPKPEKPEQQREFEIDVETIKKRLFEMYPIGLVPRTDISRATGGILSPRTMSNLDTRGEGIERKINVGKKRCYPVEDVIEYVAGKISKVIK